FEEGTLMRRSEQRGLFFTPHCATFPRVTSEPDSHRMSDTAGPRSLLMRDPDNEKSIALEGLKELFSEYVKGQVQPETAGDIEKFLTRIRAVLDVFFKARSEEHTSELQSRENLVCRLLLEKKNKKS